MHRLNYEKKDLGYSFGIAVAVMVTASLALSLIFGENAVGWKFWLEQALYTLCLGGSAFLYAAFVKTNPIAASKLNVKPRLAHMGWGILAIGCLIFGMMPLNCMFLDAIEAIGLNRPKSPFDDPANASVAGLLLVATLLPAFCEEFIFRGVVAQSAAGMKSKLATLAVSGALFSLFHANPAQTLHQFVLGAFITLLVLRSGSLWTGIAAHLFNNAFVVALNYTELGKEEFWRVSTNTGTVLPIMFAGLIGFALCVFGYLKTTRSVWTVTNDGQKTDSASVIVLVASAAVCLVLWVSALFV